jgi:hypothetical protein
MQGTTMSEIQVREDGTVGSIKVTMAHPFFRDYVQSALMQWKFAASSKPFVQKVTVRFWLEDCKSGKADARRETRVEAELPELVEVRTCSELLVANVN